MTQTERNEGHILCAEFLGWKRDPGLTDHWVVSAELIRQDLFEYSAYQAYDMLFSHDWNWLMIAWDKLRKTVFEANDNVYPHPFDSMTDVWGVNCILSEKEAAFGVLVKAIKWYNSTL